MKISLHFRDTLLQSVPQFLQFLLADRFFWSIHQETLPNVQIVGLILVPIYLLSDLDDLLKILEALYLHFRFHELMMHFLLIFIYIAYCTPRCIYFSSTSFWRSLQSCLQWPLVIFSIASLDYFFEDLFRSLFCLPSLGLPLHFPWNMFHNLPKFLQALTHLKNLHSALRNPFLHHQDAFIFVFYWSTLVQIFF